MNDTKHDIRLVFDVMEAASALRLSPNTIRKAIRDGQIYAVRIGRKFLIPRDELEKLLRRPIEDA